MVGAEPEAVTEGTETPKALIIKYENFVPAYEVAKAWGLNKKEFWNKAYHMMRQNTVTCYRLQEGYRYTKEQLEYADPQDLFFLEFPGFSFSGL